jgi:hypothetical protein
MEMHYHILCALVTATKVEFQTSICGFCRHDYGWMIGSTRVFVVQGTFCIISYYYLINFYVKFA